jgi:DNA polymerase-3 subunit gamma/tau
MSETTSLYRRHRPASFDQVVGQRHVVRTLSNAIEADKVHHAYLFVGSRGTGKTSMAKILAASLNCEHGGPTLTPCGKCESCRSIQAGTSVDVIEMDAASNRSVDDIRSLRDRVAFAPAAGRWKVYILDEAHMLTKEAWNAFLKTLEEPPPNTVFILATTEAHKVMPTIADRCQRFDFQRPSIEQLTEVLDRVAASESIQVEPAAISMIARSAGGSFRDALGTLDQLLAYSADAIAIDDVLELLGAPDADLLFGVVDGVIAEDPRSVLETVESVARSGRDPSRFARDLLGHLRVLLVTRTTGEIPEAFAVTSGDATRLRTQADAIGPSNLIRTIDEIAGALASIRSGDEARLAVEVALLKAARPDLDPGTAGLVRRIERLESNGPANTAPVTQAHSDRSQEGPPAAPPEQATEPGSADPLGGRAAPESATNTDAPPTDVPTTDASPTDAPPAGASPTSVAPVVAADAGSSGGDLARVGQVWPAVLDALRSSSSGPTASYFDGTRPVALDDGRLTVGFPPGAQFNRRNAEKPERRSHLEQALVAVLGESFTLEYAELGTDQDPGGDTGSEGAAGSMTGVDEEAMVERVISEFNAEEVI